MQAEKIKVVNQCLDCNGENLPSMHFCVYCGAALKRLFSTLCLQCNSNDESSGPYCIVCGATCEPVFYPNFKNSSESVPQSPTTEQDNPAQSAPTSLITKLVKHKEMVLAAFCMAIAVVYSCVIVSRLSGTDASTKTEGKRTRQGLVIYTKSPFATLTMEDEMDHHMISATFKADGSLALDKLPSGNYILKIVAPDHKAVLKRVSIVEGSPTVLGFPKPIELPLQPKPTTLSSPGKPIALPKQPKY